MREFSRRPLLPLAIVAAATAVVGTGVLTGATAAVAPTATCTDVEMVEARGSGEAMPAGAALPKVGAAVIAQTTKTVTEFGLPYPATLNNYAQSESTGVQMLNQHLVEQTAACPNQKFVLTGYSQGAQVVADVMGGSPTTGSAPLAADLAAKVVDIQLYGDPSHTPNAAYNVGTASAATGIFQRDAATLAPYAAKITSYCDTGDPFCAQGNDINVHLQYANVYLTQSAATIAGSLG